MIPKRAGAARPARERAVAALAGARPEPFWTSQPGAPDSMYSLRHKSGSTTKHSEALISKQPNPEVALPSGRAGTPEEVHD